MQDKFSIINDSLEALEYTQVTGFHGIRHGQATELGMILDTMLHKPKDKRLDVDVDAAGPRNHTSRVGLYKIQRRRG